MTKCQQSSYKACLSQEADNCPDLQYKLEVCTGRHFVWLSIQKNDKRVAARHKVWLLLSSSFSPTQRALVKCSVLLRKEKLLMPGRELWAFRKGVDILDFLFLESTSEKGQFTIILLLVPRQTPSNPRRDSVILIKAASPSLLRCYGWVVLLLCGYATLVYSSVDKHAGSFYFWLSWPVLLWRFTCRLPLLSHSSGCTELPDDIPNHCVILFTLALEVCSNCVRLTCLW